MNPNPEPFDASTLDAIINDVEAGIHTFPASPADCIAKELASCTAEWGTSIPGQVCTLGREQRQGCKNA